MESLTKLKGIGTEILAWCPGCKTWISDVELIDGCHPGNRTYAYCPACNEAILRSIPIPDDE